MKGNIRLPEIHKIPKIKPSKKFVDKKFTGNKEFPKKPVKFKVGKK